jgi:hypothetical protein
MRAATRERGRRLARGREPDVRRRVAHEQHRHQQGRDRDRGTGDDEHVARGNDPASQPLNPAARATPP